MKRKSRYLLISVVTGTILAIILIMLIILYKSDSETQIITIKNETPIALINDKIIYNDIRNEDVLVLGC